MWTSVRSHAIGKVNRMHTIDADQQDVPDFLFAIVMMIIVRAWSSPKAPGDYSQREHGEQTNLSKLTHCFLSV